MKTQITVADFCHKHKLPAMFAVWADKRCSNMQDFWNNAPSDWVESVAFCEGVLTFKERTLFHAWVLSQLPGIMESTEGQSWIRSIEAYATGEATLDQVNSGQVEVIPLVEKLCAQERLPPTHESVALLTQKAAGNTAATWLRTFTTPNFNA